MQPPPSQDKPWAEKISRTGYFFGALLFHLIVFIMVATWIVFPAFHPPPDSFGQVPPPAPAPPPPAPPKQPVTTPLVDVAADNPPAPSPSTVVTTNPNSYLLPMPDVAQGTDMVDAHELTTGKIPSKSPTLSPERLKKILELLKASGRTLDDILNSDGNPKNIKAKFVVYLAAYADGDWGCNSVLHDGKLDAGSLPNLLAKVGEWSHGNITAEVVPTPLNIGGPDLIDKKPPFIFFTGHKDFKLTDQEIQNLRDYLQMGGAIWGDNALAGRGSRFDVAFRREMKRVVPDLDKNFKPFDMTDDMFTKWFAIANVPRGMNYYAEPLEHLDIDGKLAILYTPNDYSDMLTMRILPGDAEMEGDRPDRKAKPYSPLFTSGTFLYNRGIFFRNFDLSNCLACNQLGMNIIGFFLTRFDKDLLLATP